LEPSVIFFGAVPAISVALVEFSHPKVNNLGEDPF